MMHYIWMLLWNASKTDSWIDSDKVGWGKTVFIISSSVASSLIANNENRVGKTLFTDGEEGELVYLDSYRNGKDEAVWIGEKIDWVAVSLISGLIDMKSQADFSDIVLLFV